MESRHDSETAERILYNMRPKELVRTHMHVINWFWSDFIWQAVCLQVEVIKKAYMQGEVEVEEPEEGEDGEEEHSASPRNVGHNIYILAHQVRSKHHLDHSSRLLPFHTHLLFVSHQAVKSIHIYTMNV